MAGIGVVSNPRSGINRRRPQLAQQLAYVLGDRGELAQPDGVDRLVAVAESFRRHEIDILCINGGDGTTHEVLTAFVAVYGSAPLPTVALLRGGTINNVARSIGLPRLAPEALLGRLVARYHAREELPTIERSLAVVDGTHVGFQFGNGLVASFMEAYYEGGTVGTWKAMRVLARTAASAVVGGPFIRRLLRPVRAQVSVDGRRLEPTEYLSVAAATIPDMGLGFRPFHEIDRHPDRIQVLGFACPVHALVASLPRWYWKRPSRRPDIVSAIGRELVIESDSPMAFQLDGDLIEGGARTVVRVGPRVRLVNG
jgi:diacylglycerol kinase family enzyme